MLTENEKSGTNWLSVLLYLVVLAFILFVLLLAARISYVDWDTFAKDHHCRVIETNGNAAAWLCEDNKIYWKYGQVGTAN